MVFYRAVPDPFSSSFSSDIVAYYVRARFYAPSQGRFLSRDPLGLDEEKEAMHYIYSKNSPVLLSDPSGFGPGVSIPAPKVKDVKPDNCGQISWTIPWVAGPEIAQFQNGWLVQRVEVQADVTPCCEGSEPKLHCRLTYYEAWKVQKGMIQGKATDTFSFGQPLRGTNGPLGYTGRASISGRAVFIPLVDTSKAVQAAFPKRIPHWGNGELPLTGDCAPILGNLPFGSGALLNKLETKGATKPKPEWIVYRQKLWKLEWNSPEFLAKNKAFFASHSLHETWNCCGQVRQGPFQITVNGATAPAPED